MGKLADLDITFTTTHKLTIEITEGNLHDHITAAIESDCGSGYWAEIDTGEHLPGWANYFTATFTVTEDSDEKVGAVYGQAYALSIEKLLAGLAVLRDKYPHHFCDIIKQEGDATTGDVLVQCALFGDIVYS
jgi:hypothetical protein